MATASNIVLRRQCLPSIGRRNIQVCSLLRPSSSLSGSKRHLHALKQPLTRPTLRAITNVSARQSSVTKQVAERFSRIKSYARTAMYTTAGVGLVLGTGYAVYKTSTFMASLNFAHVTSFGFYLGGIASAGLVLVAAALFRRLRGIHPESVFSEAMTRIARSPTVSKHLGDKLHSGTFKAYSHRGGFTVSQSSMIPSITYEPFGLQLLFQVSGSQAGGIASVDAVSTGAGRFKIASLALDMQDGTRYVLAGNPEQVVYQGIMKLR